MEHTNRTIRPLTQQDLEAYLDIYLNAYPAYKTLDEACREHYREKHRLELREDRQVQTVGLFEGDVLIATMKLILFSMNCFGRMQTACGLMALEVHPLHKKQGAARVRRPLRLFGFLRCFFLQLFQPLRNAEQEMDILSIGQRSENIPNLLALLLIPFQAFIRHVPFPLRLLRFFSLSFILEHRTRSSEQVVKVFTVGQHFRNRDDFLTFVLIGHGVFLL